jgi:hypothetical protein
MTPIYKSHSATKTLPSLASLRPSLAGKDREEDRAEDAANHYELGDKPSQSYAQLTSYV